jgi:hypothetical protein
MYRVLTLLFVTALPALKLLGQPLQLSTPRANIGRAMLSEEALALVYDFRMEGALIRYTTDGTKPNESSAAYEDTLYITTPSTIQARAFHPDFLPSDIVVSSFVLPGKKIAECRINPPSPAYPGDGAATLYDLQFSTSDFKKGYVGFTGQALVAEIRFSKKQKIQKAHISYLVNQGAWIFGPAHITVADGKGRVLARYDLPQAGQESPAQNHIAEIGFLAKRHQYIKVTATPLAAIPSWHPGSGNPAWLFVDEVWVE